jgi:uracil DNA glycosylase
MDKKIKEAQDTLCDRLSNTGWGSKLRFFVRSSEFYDLLLRLYLEKENDYRFTPALKYIFLPFELCHFSNLQAIVVMSEPYTNPIFNTGLAVQSTEDIPQSIAFTKALGRGIGEIADRVLLLNASLTAQIDYPNAHFEIWKPFRNYLFDVLNRVDDLAWLFIGTGDCAKLIDNQTHLKIVLPQLPTFRNETWECGDAFEKVNNYVNKIKSVPVW